MTFPEILGTAVAAIGAGYGAYRSAAGKLEGLLGKKENDDTLRDVVMRIEGKLDAHREATSNELHSLSERVGYLERRVFTPPGRPALRSAPGDQ